ncbi:MAG: hypothetical protein GEV09_03725 [Pseudonocardiaceae bacterium]|nr:hypothetical protein [Pseudonocardiaceae bacterium]
MSLLSESVEPSPAGPADGRGWPDLLRVLLLVACGPAVAGYALAVAVLGLLVASSAGAEIAVAGTARAAGAAWLAAHRVPLLVDGAPLGALPLLPTVLLGLLVATTAGRLARRHGLDQPLDAARIAGTVAGVHALVGVGIALAVIASAVGAAPVRAALGCGAVAGLAAVCGLAQPCGLLPALLHRAPGWAWHALAGTAVALVVLLTGGLAIVLAALAASATTVHDLYGAWGTGAGSALGMTLLSIAYLPNAAVAAVSWSAGPGVSIGAFSATPLGVLPGPLPAVPLLAALPEGQAAAWWAVVFGLPLLAGAAAGRRCRAAGDDPVMRARAAVAATGGVAVACLVLAALASGRLGGGPFDPVQVPAWSFAAAAVVWILPPAALVAWWSGRPGVPDGQQPAANGEAAQGR